MKLFAGLSKTDYQDAFRAIGALVDDRGLRDIRLWEHEGGIILQGRCAEDGGAGQYQTLLLGDDDLKALLDEVYDRRGLPARGLLSRPSAG